jgi:hypothetical protein
MKFVLLLQKYSLCFGLVTLFGMALQPHTYAAQAVPANVPQKASISPQQVKTVVYYFHGNMRCSSCKKIEAYTKEAVQSGFSEALNNGTLELKVVNVEEPGNDHYVQDFQLYTRSVVLERRSGGKPNQWKNLDRVWSLTRNKAAFMEYVQEQTLAMMKGQKA